MWDTAGNVAKEFWPDVRRIIAEYNRKKAADKKMTQVATKKAATATSSQ